MLKKIRMGAVLHMRQWWCNCCVTNRTHSFNIHLSAVPQIPPGPHESAGRSDHFEISDPKLPVLLGHDQRNGGVWPRLGVWAPPQLEWRSSWTLRDPCKHLCTLRHVASLHRNTVFHWIQSVQGTKLTTTDTYLPIHPTSKSNSEKYIIFTCQKCWDAVTQLLFLNSSSPFSSALLPDSKIRP